VLSSPAWLTHAGTGGICIALWCCCSSVATTSGAVSDWIEAIHPPDRNLCGCIYRCFDLYGFSNCLWQTGASSAANLYLPARHLLNLGAISLPVARGRVHESRSGWTATAVDHDYDLLSFGHPSSDGDRRCRYAGRDLNAQQLL